MTYLDSLRRTAEMDVELVLPGHGEPITDHRALIGERLRMHHRRAEKLFGLDLRTAPQRLPAGPNRSGATSR